MWNNKWVVHSWTPIFPQVLWWRPRLAQKQCGNGSFIDYLPNPFKVIFNSQGRCEWAKVASEFVTLCFTFSILTSNECGPTFYNKSVIIGCFQIIRPSVDVKNWEHFWKNKVVSAGVCTAFSVIYQDIYLDDFAVFRWRRKLKIHSRIYSLFFI